MLPRGMKLESGTSIYRANMLRNITSRDPVDFNVISKGICIVCTDICVCKKHENNLLINLFLITNPQVRCRTHNALCILYKQNIIDAHK